MKMSKECIQAKAEDISKLLYEVYDVPNGICEHIKVMAQRLEAIDNANPSEALERLENNKNAIPYAIDYRIIKQALIKAQEQEKVLEILFEKEVSIFQLKSCKNVNEYNDLKFKEENKLTEEEFDLVKRYSNEITRVKD